MQPDNMEYLNLLEFLSKYSLILHQISPYLSVSSLLSLAATNRSFRSLILNSKETFRYLDLSDAKRARVNLPPIDVGGFNWRHERIDESTTVEDFYAGPIRGIFSYLERKDILHSIQVLILDNCSAPAEVLGEIIRDTKYQVRILSVINCQNLNEKKFQHELRYACRATRPMDTPRIKGVYIFGTSSRPSLQNLAFPVSIGVTNSPGAQLGAALNRKSHEALQSSGSAADVNPWYKNSGKVLPRSAEISDWAGTLRICEDIIAFDAVLCRGPRHDPSSDVVQMNSKAFLGPQVASVALQGCETCHSLPEKAPSTNDAPSSRLPLLLPVPRHSTSIKNAQQPPQAGRVKEQLLFVRCTVCCLDRWCEGCGKFWCENHYDISNTVSNPILTASENPLALSIPPSPVEIDNGITSRTSYLKVHLGLCIEQCLVSELMAGAGSDGMWG